MAEDITLPPLTSAEQELRAFEGLSGPQDYGPPLKTETTISSLNLDGFISTVSQSSVKTVANKIVAQTTDPVSILGQQIQSAVSELNIYELNRIANTASSAIADVVNTANTVMNTVNGVFDSLSSIESMLFDVFSLASIEGFGKFIIGIIERPFLILEEVFNFFWDPMSIFMTDSLLSGDFFFQVIDEIIPEPIESAFTDLRKGVLPGTLYERPIDKYPLFPSEPDVHRVSRNDPTVYQPGGMKWNYDKERDALLNEPEMHYNPTYPYNHYTTTESGHVFEHDDTPSYERIQMKHKSGTGYHINPDGTQKTTVVGDDFKVVVSNQGVHIFGKMELYVDAEANISVNGDAKINVARNAEVYARRDVEVHALRDLKAFSGRDMEFHAKENMTLSCDGNMSLYSGKEYKVQSEMGVTILTEADMMLAAKWETNLESDSLLSLIAPNIDVNYGPASPFTVDETVPAPIAQDPHEMEAMALAQHQFDFAYEGYPGVEQSISLGSINSSMRAGTLGTEDWVQRKPDMVLKKETDESGGGSSGSPPEGITASPEGDLRDPSNPIYDLKISKHAYLRDLTLSPYFSHYLRKEQCGLPVEEIIKNLSRLALAAFDPLYEKYGGIFVNTYGRPKSKFRVTSALRKPSSCRSWHEKGCAFDFQIQGLGKGYYFDVAVWCKQNITGFDHILLEYKTTGSGLPWIHIGVTGGGGGSTQTYMDHKKYDGSKFVNLMHKQKPALDINSKANV